MRSIVELNSQSAKIVEVSAHVVISAKNLWKIYNGSQTTTIALQNATLEVREGTFTAILGPSGSGKSTLLHLLAGIDKVSKKSDQKLDINGISMLGKKENALAKIRAQNVGFILQFFGLLPTLTVKENIMIAGYFAGKKAKNRETKAEELLNLVGLGDRMDYYPNQLSGGQKQRVAVCRALINDPKILFADEPTGNLDSASGMEILTLLRSLVDRLGMTVVLVTHDPRIFDFADRIIEIMDGNIVADNVNQKRQIKKELIK